MQKMIQNVGIISKPAKADLAGVVPPLLDWLRQRGVAVCYDRETADAIGQSHSGGALDREQVAARADLLVVLGGDGTLLHAARLLDERDIPVLAINLGGLGFLTSFPLSELYPALELALSGKLHTSDRKLLQVEVLRKGQVAERHLALNDAVVNKGALARILDYDLHLDGSYACSYKADGIIFSTPTGSTAYSLSAGGPILYPVVEALVITPICPHTLTNRPLVIPDSAKIEIDFKSEDDAVFLTLDGQVGIELVRGDHIVARKAPEKLYLVRPAKKTYFEVLRNKLKWGER